MHYDVRIELLPASEIAWPSHRLRCEALLNSFHKGKITIPVFTEKARLLGFDDGEIRTEIEMREGCV